MPAGNRPGRPTKGVRSGDQKPVSVPELARAHDKRFRKVTWREGSRGKRASRFWATRVHTAQDGQHGQAPGPEVWWLGEWPVGENEPVQYYWCDLPQDLILRRF